ncbi:MAG: hypothetical protein IJX39_09160 [Clostridia bacterium]|nr:hypothetical protein [Clostridia bacterium]
MKLQYWGTAAAEGVPAIFCRCEVCQEARKRGGRNLRGRPNALIDGVLKIDFNPDTYQQSIRYGVDLTELRYLLVTHTHSDHFYPKDIFMRRKGFANYRGDNVLLTVYGSDKVVEQIRPAQESKSMEGLLDSVLLRPFDTVQIDKYTVTAYPGHHAPDSGPLIYGISDGERSLLYCHDSGPLKEEVWENWKANGTYFNYVSMDCTEGATPSMSYAHHMNLARDIELRDRMLAEGVADEKTVFCCNHFSHNGGNSLYDEFKEIAAKEGFIVSYDGMEVEI